MRHRTRHGKARSGGVTLIELAVTIALVGILVGLVMYFGSPIKGYTDSSRRAAMADAADTALRRIGRDLRLALPNSVRISGGGTHLELLLVRAGGRYRGEEGPAEANSCGTAADDVLAFGAADTCFKTLGDLANVTEIAGSDFVVVYNLAPGTPGADAYESGNATGGNKSKIDPGGGGVSNGSGSERIHIESNAFIHESPGRRFFIIEGPVSYVCSGNQLLRYSGYGIQETQPTSDPALPSGAARLLVDGVAGCEFTYDADTNAQGSGLVTLRLKLSTQVSGGGTETVTLYHAVHVNNVP